VGVGVFEFDSTGASVAEAWGRASYPSSYPCPSSCSDTAVRKEEQGQAAANEKNSMVVVVVVVVVEVEFQIVVESESESEVRYEYDDQ
jgi:hypothetical protein